MNRVESKFMGPEAYTILRGMGGLLKRKECKIKDKKLGTKRTIYLKMKKES